MTDKLIPADAKLAAKRGFLRTTYQAYAGALAGGITASGIISAIQGEVDPLVVGVTLGVALVSPLISGAASYFDIAAKGIPGDYEPRPPFEDSSRATG